jgi:outer membrane protein assembly factor BamD (BamD/ComL family)
MLFRNIILSAAVLALLALSLSASAAPGVSPGPGIRYATDAYPGFDREDEILSPAKKTPRWFGWLNGPEKDTAAEQLKYAEECFRAGSLRAARKGYDALVRSWPASPEAPLAQKALADLYLGSYLEYENAFREYRYLLDFYSAQCDYDAVAAEMYRVAELMREEGKRLLFFRFANTVDVRRAYEALVLRAPGAKFVPEAMLTIAALREDEERYETAVTVYENLRNLHAGTPEAREAAFREAGARMIMLRKYGYNRSRVNDTIDFLKLVLSNGELEADKREEVAKMLEEARMLVEDEAFREAKFYDSRMRTRRSAVNAYEAFLKEYPASVHASEVRLRLSELHEESAAK